MAINRLVFKKSFLAVFQNDIGRIELHNDRGHLSRAHLHSFFPAHLAGACWHAVEVNADISTPCRCQQQIEWAIRISSVPAGTADEI